MKFSFRIATLLLIFVGFFTVILNGQSPGDVLDGIKDAEDWQSLFGMYDMIMVVITLIFTEVSKFIPFFKKISGPWKAVIVTVIVVVAGALKFGIGSIASPVIIWTLVTLIYDKLIKPKPGKEEPS